MATLYDKEKYAVHEKHLKLGLDNGLETGHIYNVIRSNHSKFLKPYIDFNTKKRNGAKNKFEEDFVKLMNNVVYGKTLEKMHNRTKKRLVNDRNKLEKYVRNPECYSCSLINVEQAPITVMKTILHV